MKRHIRFIATICLVAVIVLQLSIPVMANSARMHWEGTDTTGAIVTDAECPIVVEHELLTFDIEQFPEMYYREVSDFQSYTGKVTAEYTFYNPADYEVSATLVFPFGSVPDYGVIRDSESDKRLRFTDTEKYDITIDGESVEKELRHTLCFYGAQFELENDMSKLHDGYMKDEFYDPDMPVTRYTYMPENVDLDTYNAAGAAFRLSSDSEKTKVYVEGQNGGTVSDDGVLVEGWVDYEDGFVVNVIGEPLEQMPEWKFYENGACEKEIEGTMVLEDTETMTLKELVLQEFDEMSGILDYDWYNAIITAWNYFEWSHGVIPSTEIGFDISDQLMRWYKYEITLEPGQKIVNKVEAPIYPFIDASYESPVYEYTYLLSPAKTWKDFGTLDVVINTPYYLIENENYEFEEQDQGYTINLEKLPEGELRFVLCEEKEPQKPLGGGSGANFIGTIVLAAMALVCFVLSYRQFHERGFLFNNAYIYASKEERARMNKKPHYRQSGIVFLLIGVIFAMNAVEMIFHTGWLFYCVIAIAIITIVYAIVSSIKSMNTKK